MLNKISLLQQFQLENNFCLFVFLVSSHCHVTLSAPFITSMDKTLPKEWDRLYYGTACSMCGLCLCTFAGVVQP